MCNRDERGITKNQDALEEMGKGTFVLWGSWQRAKVGKWVIPAAVRAIPGACKTGVHFPGTYYLWCIWSDPQTVSQKAVWYGKKGQWGYPLIRPHDTFLLMAALGWACQWVNCMIFSGDWLNLDIGLLWPGLFSPADPWGECTGFNSSTDFFPLLLSWSFFLFFTFFFF